jgi:hypothetical protein
MARSAWRKFGNAWQPPTTPETEEQWRRERQLLESLGEQTIFFMTIGTPRREKNFYDLSPGAAVEDRATGLGGLLWR